MNIFVATSFDGLHEEDANDKNFDEKFYFNINEWIKSVNGVLILQI